VLRVVSHPEAEQELEAAAIWYQEKHPGLGDDFLNEFEATVRRILCGPEQGRRIFGDNRKLNFPRFPYAIVYAVKGEAIFVKAVMHLHRRPFYWKSRA